MILEYLHVESNSQIADGIYETVLDCGGNPEIFPGQFIEIYPENPVLTLPRPISICDSSDGRIRIVYRAVGKGTEEFASYRAGKRVKVLYPLGNGFDVEPAYGKKCVIAGGGLGTPPLLFLAKVLFERRIDFSIFLGFAKDTFLTDEFKKYSKKVFVITEKDSAEKGNVLDLLRKHDYDGEVFFACGPAPMLKAICSYISEKGATGQVSLEQRMACGFGSCVGCAVKIRRENERGWQYLKACKDGPVFICGEVMWD